MRYATTFSGIGGWEIGLNACGWELAWQCEREPFCRTLLAERFGVPICRDIRHLVRWLEGMRRRGFDIMVDVLVGSPPCQPFSVAGAQRGTADPRHLFPAFLGVVRFLRPTWILMEQVPAILSAENGKAFEGYVGGLAALGYDLLWHCVPACAVGACHRRERLWIVGHARSPACQRHSGTVSRAEAGKRGAGQSDGDLLVRPADAGPGSGERDVVTPGTDASRRIRQRTAPGTTGHAPFLGQNVADAAGPRRCQGKSEAGRTVRNQARRSEPQRLGGPVSGTSGNDTHPTRELQHGGGNAGTKGRIEPADLRETVAHAASLPTRSGKPWRPRIDSSLRGQDEPVHVLDYERWAHAIPSWWLAEPPVGRVADGIPHRVDSLKGLGNAVVPQIPFLIGQAINAFLRSQNR